MRCGYCASASSSCANQAEKGQLPMFEDMFLAFLIYGFLGFVSTQFIIIIYQRSRYYPFPIPAEQLTDMVRCRRNVSLIAAGITIVIGFLVHQPL